MPATSRTNIWDIASFGSVTDAQLMPSANARRPVAALCVLALCAALVLVLALRLDGRDVQGPRAPGLAGMWWPDPPRLGPFSLVDQEGRAFTEQTLRGAWTLLFFGYTNCPDVCPATLALIDRACAVLAAGDDGQPPQVWFVSVDAQRDSPPVLARYVRHFDPAFHAATAPMAELHLLTRQLAADFTRVAGDEQGEYWYEHSASIFLVAPDLRVVGEFAAPLDAESLAERVRNVRLFIDARS